MHVTMRSMAVTAGFLALFLFASSAAASVNKSISIGDNSSSDGADTVNGSIKIGSNATVTGSVETVNGSIRVGDGTSIEDASTVNGSLKFGDSVKTQDLVSVNGTIRLGTQSVVDGYIEVVNGEINIGNGTTVSRDVSNVNGEIRLSGADVSGDLTTVTGDVLMEDEAVLRGDLTVQKPSSWNNKNRNPKVTIGPGSSVLGEIIIEHEVDLYISNTATVGEVSGVMSLDDAVRFDGARP